MQLSNISRTGIIRRPALPLHRAQSSVAWLVICVLLAGTGAARAADDNPRVRLVTSLGNIDVELFEDEAPQTVANFLRLVDQDFYDGLIFHRVIAGFMVQAGGYDAGLNYREAPGTVRNESDNGLSNDRGTLAMARLADPDSAGSQFFINVEDNSHLNGSPGRPGYTVFGQVVDGMDVVTEIELLETARRAGMDDVPTAPVVIDDAERIE